MNVLVSYSRPHGKYGRYIFTTMIYFAKPTESATIEVKRPETQTQTYTVYRCGYCGRWATITVHHTTTVNTPLRPAAHQKDGRLELYRYDNVEPDDFMEFTLRDSELLKYQMTRVDVGWDDVSLESYWRYVKFDKLRVELQAPDDDITAWLARTHDTDVKHFWNYEKQRNQDRARLAREESHMKTEFLYRFNLLNWDEYMDSRLEDRGELHVEEDLIQKTMNAEVITIQELRLEPVSQLPAIQGQQQFIEGELHYLTD